MAQSSDFIRLQNAMARFSGLKVNVADHGALKEELPYAAQPEKIDPAGTPMATRELTEPLLSLKPGPSSVQVPKDPNNDWNTELHLTHNRAVLTKLDATILRAFSQHLQSGDSRQPQGQQMLSSLHYVSNMAKQLEQFTKLAAHIRAETLRGTAA